MAEKKVQSQPKKTFKGLNDSLPVVYPSSAVEVIHDTFSKLDTYAKANFCDGLQHVYDISDP